MDIDQSSVWFRNFSPKIGLSIIENEWTSASRILYTTIAL